MILRFVIFFSFLFALDGLAANGSLVIDWKFSNVVKGYDHQNKIVVYIDGKRVGEAKSSSQQVKGTFKCTVSTGKHAIKVVNFAFYDGKWEEHTIDNGYSIDANYYVSRPFEKENNLSIIWDMKGVKNSFVWKGKMNNPPEKVKNAIINLAVEFSGVDDGYDYTCRLVVYLDGVRFATSETYKESDGLQFSFEFPEGQHELIIQNEILYKGNWEPQLIDNNYALDARFQSTQIFKKTSKLNLLFDIDLMQTIPTWEE